jgi:hypothetical protein
MRRTQPVFETIPLGCVWTSYDFVLYLFVRYRAWMSPDLIKVVLRDITARAVGDQTNMTPKTKAVWTRRMSAYHHRVDQVDRMIRQLP